MKPVLAYHLILTAYGFWLPNDPRGSWSTFTRNFDLDQTAGKATKINTHQSVAHHPHDHAARQRAKDALQFPPVIFTGMQARAITQGFADYCNKNRRTCYACAILPDHAHLILARCELTIEILATHLKARATSFMNKQDIHPLKQYTQPNDRPPSPWARKDWHVFLYSEADIIRVIRYINQNPTKAGHKAQQYSWVKPFKG